MKLERHSSREQFLQGFPTPPNTPFQEEGALNYFCSTNKWHEKNGQLQRPDHTETRKFKIQALEKFSTS